MLRSRFALDGPLIVRVLDLLVTPALRLVLKLREATLVGGRKRLIGHQLLCHGALAVLLHKSTCMCGNMLMIKRHSTAMYTNELW